MANLVCPNCNTPFTVPDSVSSAACPTCGATVVNPLAASTSTAAAPVAAATTPAPSVSAGPSHSHAARAAASAAFADASPLGEGAMRPLLPRVFDAFLDKLRGLASESLFHGVSRLALFAGEWLTFAAIVILFIASFISAVSGASVRIAFEGVMIAVGIAIGAILLLYVALQVIVVGAKLLRTSPTRLNSKILLYCVAVLFAAKGINTLAAPFQHYPDAAELIPTSVTADMPVEMRAAMRAEMIKKAEAHLAESTGSGLQFFEQICAAVLMSLPWFAAGLLALNPTLLNIEIMPETTAGETAIGLASFFLKAAVAVLPITLGTGALATIIAALIGIFKNSWALTNAQGYLKETLIFPLEVMAAFFLYYLIVDLCRSILSIPKNRI